MKRYAEYIKKEKEMKKERECPNCKSLVDITGVEKYEVVECHNCNGEFEYNGIELIEEQYYDRY